jgi:hypothetical protein
VKHLGDGDALALLFLDGHAQSAVAPAGVAVEGAELRWRHELAVRILKLANKPSRGFLVERSGVDGVDEARGDEVEHLAEEPSAVCGCTLLKNESTHE